MSPKPALSLLTILLLLSGCARETCETGVCTPDERLVAAVKANIAEHSALLGDHLRVQSDAGTVYLYGLVSTHVELVDVEEVARATAGVKQVVNLCTIDNERR